MGDDIQRIEQLFQAAADLPPSERSSYLDSECGDDEELKSHVHRLLLRLETATVDSPNGGDGLNVADGLHVGPFPAAVIPEGPGSFIDRYKLLQVIGEGGFGVVYMAEQQSPVVRKVALKIIKLGMDTREVVARFEAERQALAMMDHPNIASVLDAGATASGRPYFVMELVRGISFTEFCEKNQLSTRERLELFLPVCQAVHHAHQKGVIHRDLKPSNVMVTMRDDEPMPKVIDFGIAKAMHTRLTEKTLFTRYEQFVGTPAYMSPEQAEMSALDIDTRTDIYSLGVLLYEVLTGTTPFDETTLRKAGLAEILRIIREEQPPRPSLRISTSGNATSPRISAAESVALSRSLRGDLDWIVMKSIEKERGRRYASASELSDDIRRHLHNEPVVAGPPGTAYRVKKFLARNRAAMISAGLLAMALIAGFVGTTWGLIQSRRSAAIATRQSERALASVDFLLSTLSLANPEVALNPDVSVRTLLDDTSERVGEEFAAYPGAEIRVRATIGRAYHRLGQHELAETHLRRVLEMMQEIAQANDSAQLTLRAVGFDEREYYSALWALTNVVFKLQRSDSFAMAAEAQRVGMQHLARTNAQLADQLQTLLAMLQRDAWSHESNAMDGVPGLFERVAAAADASLPHGDPNWPIVADVFLSGGYTVWYTPHEALAESLWRKALEIQQRELPVNHPDINTSIQLLVGVLNQAGKLEESEALVRDSVASLKTVFHEEMLPVALAEGALGETLVMQERFAEAEPILLRSHENILDNVQGESNYMALESLSRVVDLYRKWDRPDTAEPFADTIGRAAASSRYVQPWSVVQGALGPQHQRLLDAGNRFTELAGGLSYTLTPGVKHVAQIGPVVTELIESRDEVLESPSPRSAALARLMLGWANTLAPEQHAKDRARLAQAALDELELWSDQLPLDAAEAASLLAESAKANQQPSQANQYGLRASKLLGEAPEAGDWMMVAQRIRVVRNLLAAGMRLQAEPILVSGYRTMVAQLGERHPDTLIAREMLRQLYLSQGKSTEASQYAPPPAGLN